MNILIIGAGAIGSLIGGKLALAGHAVTLVGRPKFAAIVNAQGLAIEEADGRQQIDNVVAVGSLNDAFAQATSAYDLAVLTVKGYDTAGALDELAAAVTTHNAITPTVLSMQNGVGNEAAISAAIGPERVLAGVITTPVSIPEPGVIRVDKPRYNIGIARWRPETPKDIFERFYTALLAAGFTPTIYTRPRSMKWTKLLMNMVGNATSAILDAPPDEVFADEMMVDLEIEAWCETLTVMQASGIHLQNMDGYPLRWLGGAIRYGPKSVLRSVLRKQVGGARGGKMPSLYIDLHSGKDKSEVEWLNGAVMRAGAALDIATPVNTVLTRTLLTLLHEPGKRQLWHKNYLRLAVSVDEYREQMNI